MEPDKDDMLSVKIGTALRSMDKFVDIIDHGKIFPPDLEKPLRSLVRTVAQVSFLQFDHVMKQLADLTESVKANKAKVDAQGNQIRALAGRISILESRMVMCNNELDGIHKHHVVVDDD